MNFTYTVVLCLCLNKEYNGSVLGPVVVKLPHKKLKPQNNIYWFKINLSAFSMYR
jgi:hypothetical protein